MIQATNAAATIVHAPIAELVEGVAADGYAAVPQFVAPAHVAALRERAQMASARMHPAKVGRAAVSVRDVAVRGDTILWLDEADADAAERALFATLEALRLAANARTWLGLLDFEGHYACYPAGAFYARHRDRFRDQDTRTLTFVLYLNDAWHDVDGGALRLYRDDDSTLDVLPRGGTAVAFEAARFDHEVLPATRARWSCTGWFRRRAM